MRRNQKRIWDDCVLSDRKCSDRLVLSNCEITQLIDGYSQWIDDYLVHGWEGYFVTVMFHPLRGDHRAKVTQMHRDLTRMYGRLATRYVRNNAMSLLGRVVAEWVFYSGLSSSQAPEGGHPQALPQRWPAHAWGCSCEPTVSSAGALEHAYQ
jgi:hypothetical protein